MLRILVADDHPVVRRGLRQIISDAFPTAVLEEAPDAAGTREAVRKAPWDVVVLDLMMPGANTLDFLKELKAERPALPVLILSMHPPEQFAVRALRAGAAGYLTKETAPEELAEAIRTTLGGRKYITPDVGEQLALAMESSTAAIPHQALSDREYAVLRMIASGQSVTEIASTLHLSAKTVSTYRTRLLRKMGLRTNADLTRYALHRGLVS
jgi:two-component system invasion response regulator UvrY